MSAALAASAVDITFKPGGFRLLPALAARVQADDDVETGIAQIQRVRVSLASIADDGDRAALQAIEIAVFFVKAFQHSSYGLPG